MSNILDKDEPIRPKSGGVSLIRYLIKIEATQYSGEARESLETGRCCLEDIDHVILNGRLHKKQIDELKQSADGWKYVFVGPDLAGYDLYCCGKILRHDSGELFLIITAHEANLNFQSKGARKPKRRAEK